MNRWPHQVRGVRDVLAAVAAGHRTILLTAPTGAGKSVMMQDLALDYLNREKRVLVYSNRKLLVDQLVTGFTTTGFDLGVRASGYASDPDALLQLSSVQTEMARHVKTGGLFDAHLVIVDEAHLNTGQLTQEIITWHLGTGAVVVGVTATPIGLGHIYSVLVAAGVQSELRACGALVRATHYGPDEPDLVEMDRFRRQARKKKRALSDETGEEFSDEEAAHFMGPVPQLHGRVWAWYQRLNPDRKPCILFAPGVEEAHWFAQQFTAHGVPAASLSAKAVWEPTPAGDGGNFTTAAAGRDAVAARFRAGDIKVLCNRYVLREGIDFPAVEHLIFATVFGAIQTYLQAGGRGLRAAPGKTQCVVQDHGGNWHRHGSLNEDRHWQLDFSAAVYRGLRLDRLRTGGMPEPGRCPECAAVLGVIRAGTRCECGYVFAKVFRSRPVVTREGELRELTGTIYPRPVEEYRPTSAKVWAACYFRCKKARRPMTFRQVMGLFQYENKYTPPRTLKWMPRDPVDWYRLIADVPPERLIGVEPRHAEANR